MPNVPLRATPSPALRATLSPEGRGLKQSMRLLWAGALRWPAPAWPPGRGPASGPAARPPGRAARR
ncbi:hypothetical protein CHT98_13775 (plasmid) [Azospirillum brasilense]|uniref:Uncharacterized protein n=1 Tax=Azospirillum brasilense TaxID=192 RepID=A0A235HDF5_AZOBR|nr:hypothetical protein CHT98_13775 [Azospirillum brasilense]